LFIDEKDDEITACFGSSLGKINVFTGTVSLFHEAELGLGVENFLDFGL